MARQSKIEKYGLQNRALELRNNGKSYNEIAITLSKENNVKLSSMAAKRYFDNFSQLVDKKTVEVIKEDKRRVVKSINQTYDIIQTQLFISQKVLEKFNDVESIADTVEKVSDTAINIMKEMNIKISPHEFAVNIEKSISRNIKDYVLLTKEVRENNKFLSDLKEKIYDFQVVQEFISIFIDKFQERDPQITQEILKEISANPRMKWLAEEQKRLRGG
ncbi:hypothetical protein [Wukongibacter sp. M2B1]|uniref:hypothetical protein n=1 Tax=Wukongibacter sp. M2B1 TaxID=3088895 RepID=UPI003D7BB3D0